MLISFPASFRLSCAFLSCSELRSAFSQTRSNGKTFNLNDVQKHDNEDDCWIAVDGKVGQLLESNACKPPEQKD